MIENLLAVGRHFQKTSYEKEVDGEKQVGHVKRSVGKLSWMSHCHEKKLVNWQVVQLEEHPGIEEKLCRFQSELKNDLT